MKNAFAESTRLGLMYQTINKPAGQVTERELWTIGLTELDEMYNRIQLEVEKLTTTKTTSLLRRNVAKTQNDIKLERLLVQQEVIKTIVEIRQDEADLRDSASELNKEEQKFLDLLAKKQAAAEENMTAEEIQAKLDEIRKRKQGK